jgi:predicted  nucleic acid-binding Zn-ribbon protein|tara:strand:+ start:111 stop:428 length:318 start_codon:yes stop_codon:yes gene_type:complete
MDNGWETWSKHVLKELERLNENYEGLRSMNEEIKAEVAKTSAALSEIEDLKSWKARIDDVFSPSQFKQLSRDVQNLKSFKISAITIWAVIQFLTMLFIAFKDYII